MDNLWNKIKALILKLKELVIEEKKLLPVGITEFHVWADNIIAKTGKFADEDSLKWALSNMILHAESDVEALTDKYFTSRLRKAAANQVASQVFQDIKMKQEELKKQVEVTPVQPTESTNGQNKKETDV